MTPPKKLVKLLDTKELTSMDPSPEFLFSPEVLFQAMGDEGVLLNLNNSHYYGLNEVGARMWQLLQEYGTLEPVVTQMVAEYEIDEQTLRRDLETLVANLLEQELLTRADTQE